MLLPQEYFIIQTLLGLILRALLSQKIINKTLQDVQNVLLVAQLALGHLRFILLCVCVCVCVWVCIQYSYMCCIQYLECQYINAGLYVSTSTSDTRVMKTKVWIQL